MTKSEKRKEKRNIITVPVECKSLAPGKTFSAKGISINISPSGLSFYTHKRLEEGSSLSVSGPDLWAAPREGAVVWCSRIIGGLYRVGMALQ
jgi:hypothetical protein